MPFKFLNETEKTGTQGDVTRCDCTRELIHGVIYTQLGAETEEDEKVQEKVLVRV